MTPQLVLNDPWLEPYESDIIDRQQRFAEALRSIESDWESLYDFGKAHERLGFCYDAKSNAWTYSEWAPRASALSLIGDFNDWNRESHPMVRRDDGYWEISVPELRHGSRVKVQVTGKNGTHDRIPAYIERAAQDSESHDFAGQIWQPDEPYAWRDQSFDLSQIKEPYIYECHLGIAQEEGRVGTYSEFTENVLPRIASLGYNVIQMMAVQEHPYYGSFGYHVSSFFAPSSRFGTPEELKALIDRAHELGIAVLLDIVHAHAVKNFAEGLAEFDGEEGLYFHTGGRGHHDQWDSKLFDYGKREVQQFLLSNLAYWLEEFHFDGFRFDGVTSMLYFHHGNIAFDHYDKYFKNDVDWDAVLYLQLATKLIHTINPHAMIIAEDMSGMPGLCRPIEEGGMGFDYRLGMGIPDYWIKLLKHTRDEDWQMHDIWHTLTNRRGGEKTVAYAESHDQALVGDKTIAFWLMDKEMYWHMSVDDPHPVIDRGMALHKMLRLLTLALGGEGYLNFIGNEFGHPEWIDFPREGNDWNYHYARRQWSLVDDPNLKYHFLNDFDRAMLALAKGQHLLNAPPATQINVDQDNQVLVFERAGLIFVFNFHPERSVSDYAFQLPSEKGTYRLILDSDAAAFGGHGRIDHSVDYVRCSEGKLRIYTVNRTALVFRAVGEKEVGA